MLPRLIFFVMGVPLLIATASAAPTDTVPTFDVHPTCGDAAPAAATGERGSDVCVRGELAARDQLTKQWKQFPTGDRARCVQLAAMTHMPSYVEVLTCLEMERDARQLRAPADRTTTGSGH